MATLINDKVTARSLQQAMEFSVFIENSTKYVQPDDSHCHDLMNYLARTLLGWGATPYDQAKAGTVGYQETVEKETTYILHMGGVERDDEARRFYLDWAIRTNDGTDRRVINGGLMFRDNKWSVHT